MAEKQGGERVTIRALIVGAAIMLGMVVVAVVAVRMGARAGKSKFCGGVGWLAPPSDRENLSAAPEKYQQRWRRHHAGREAFSPDTPGACRRKPDGAARAELGALRVAGGH